MFKSLRKFIELKDCYESNNKIASLLMCFLFHKRKYINLLIYSIYSAVIGIEPIFVGGAKTVTQVVNSSVILPCAVRYLGQYKVVHASVILNVVEALWMYR